MRDGNGERITVDIPAGPTIHKYMDCGAALVSNHGGRFRHCADGHLHCTICHRRAHRINKGYTCGIGCKEKE